MGYPDVELDLQMLMLNGFWFGEWRDHEGVLHQMVHSRDLGVHCISYDGVVCDSVAIVSLDPHATRSRFKGRRS